MSEIIYDPRLPLDLRNVLGGPILAVGLQAALDFIAGENEPWSFYLGAALGQTATATGIVGAAATLYVIGDTVDFLFFKSPDGSDVRVFLDGIQQSDIATYAVTEAWETVQFILSGGGVHRLDLVNIASSAGGKTSPINWMAFGPITVTGDDPIAYRTGGLALALFNISYTVRDSGGADSPNRSFVIQVPRGSLTLAAVEGFAQQIATLADAVLGGVIKSISVTWDVALPGGLKTTPDTGVDNEKGGLLSFSAAGTTYSHSVRLPAFKESLFVGDTIDITDTDVDALVDAIVAGLTVSSLLVAPSDKYENDLTALVAAKKSFRK